MRHIVQYLMKMAASRSSEKHKLLNRIFKVYVPVQLLRAARKPHPHARVFVAHRHVIIGVMIQRRVEFEKDVNMVIKH